MTLQIVFNRHRAIFTLLHTRAAKAAILEDRGLSWPFHSDDVTPLQWWRTLPADRLGDAQHLLLRATLNKISPLKDREWFGSLRGDPAASIAVALGCLPIAELTLKMDLAMSVMAIHALGGNAASALVLSHVLRHAPLDHPFTRELAASWLALNLRRTMRKVADTARPGRAAVHGETHHRHHRGDGAQQLPRVHPDTEPGFALAAAWRVRAINSDPILPTGGRA